MIKTIAENPDPTFPTLQLYLLLQCGMVNIMIYFIVEHEAVFVPREAGLMVNMFYVGYKVFLLTA